MLSAAYIVGMRSAHTLPVYQAGNMVHIGNERRIPRGCQFVDSKVEGVLEALIRCFLVIVGVLRHNAHQELVQRVLDALAVECGHIDALYLITFMVLTSGLLRGWRPCSPGSNQTSSSRLNHRLPFLYTHFETASPPANCDYDGQYDCNASSPTSPSLGQ
jgi:hypothetical protein